MKKFLWFLTLVLILGLYSSASAISVGGVTWNAGSILDFSSFSIAIHQDIDENSGIASGYGILTTMNGTSQDLFVPGGELTFTFGDYTPDPSSALILPGNVGTAINYTGGWVNIYVDDTAELTNPSDPTTLNLGNTGDGELWLGLTGHSRSYADGSTLTGTVGATALTGEGGLDVVNGLAASWFDTDTMADGADLAFSNSFTTFLNKNADGTRNLLIAEGTGNYFGQTAVPEPATMLLLGLGLIGLAGIGRKES